jgi:hypothetical protein
LRNFGLPDTVEPSSLVPDPCDAFSAIVADLEKQQCRRRAHFLRVLAVSAFVVVGSLALGSVRADIWQQSPSQLVAELVVLLVSLVAMPAIGVGLWFPERRTRLAIVAIAIVASATAVSGWPAARGGPAVDGCLAIVLGTGAALVAIGVVSGAFVERRCPSSVAWVTMGLSLVALNVATVHCPETGMRHVMPWHLGSALLLMGLAAGVATLVRRRCRC